MISKIRDILLEDEFQITEQKNLGFVYVDLYGEAKKSLFLYPYFVHCYVFLNPEKQLVTLKQVVGYHALALANTEVFKNKRSRWLRIRVPITISIIISTHGFDDEAIEYVRVKQRYQMGHVNIISLVYTMKDKLYSLQKSGFVGGVPISYANKLTQRIAGVFH